MHPWRVVRTTPNITIEMNDRYIFRIIDNSSGHAIIMRMEDMEEALESIKSGLKN